MERTGKTIDPKLAMRTLCRRSRDAMRGIAGGYEVELPEHD